MSLKYRSRFNHIHTFFITTTCYQKRHLLKRGNAYDLISESLNYLEKHMEAAVLGYVLMPNHLHVLLHFQYPEKRSAIIREFKKHTSHGIRNMYQAKHAWMVKYLVYVHREQHYKIWSDRFDESPVRDRSSCERVLDYIHANPLQEHWSLVQKPEEYRYSSAGFYELGRIGPVSITHYRDIF